MKMFPSNVKGCLAFVICCLAVPLFVGACKNPLSELADALKESSDKIALAVPGEMMRRWIAECHNGTLQEQKKCKDEVAKVFGVNLDTVYQITTSFTFDDSKTTNLRADVFPGHTQDIRDAQYFVNHGPLKLDPAVGTALPTPMTEAEIKTAVEQAIRKALTTVSYNPPTVAPTVGSGGSLSPRGFVTIGASLSGKLSYTLLPEDKKRVDAFVTRVGDAILALRGERAPGVPKPTITRPYNPIDGLENVFVVIPKKDFDEATQTDQQDFFRVAVLVHENGHPDKSINFPSVQPTTFHKADFTRNPLVAGRDPLAPGGNGQFYWAVAQVTRYKSITEDSLKELEKIHGLLERMAKNTKATSGKK
jgi:hypothetical protein